MTAVDLAEASRPATASRHDAYLARRTAIEDYFDRTALEAWARLTSDAPLSRIRQTVRAGRETMRATMLSWLPENLTGARVLDAGCGPGMLSTALARRGAEVVGVDLSPELVRLGRERLPADIATRVTLVSGDLLDEGFGCFDHLVAMDVLIHYPAEEAVAMLARLSPRTARSILFTFAPKTPALALMHAAGRLFPRADRAPAIQPVAPAAFHRLIAQSPALSGWRMGRTHRVKSGFYTSEALELVRA